MSIKNIHPIIYVNVYNHPCANLKGAILHDICYIYIYVYTNEENEFGEIDDFIEKHRFQKNME